MGICCVIVTYNRKNLLIECINSILNQTIKNLEIIIVNDGSTDKTLDIVELIAKKDDRIIIINQNNRGAGAARNRGILESSGKYITFVDADDVISDNMIENLYIAMEDGIDMIQCNYIEYNKDSGEKKTVNHGFNDNEIVDDVFIHSKVIPMFASEKNRGFYSLWNKMYNRDWIIKNGLRIDENMEIGEDWWFNINCFVKANRVKFIQDYLYTYIRQNPNSLMCKYRKNQIELQLYGRKRLLDLLKDYDIGKYEVEFNRRFLYALTSNLFLEFNNNCNFNRDEYKKIIKENCVLEASKYYSSINNVSKYLWRLISKGRYDSSYYFFRVTNKMYLIKKRLNQIM